MRPLPPLPEQKEARRHGEAAFPMQQYTTKLSPAAPDVFAHWHDEAEFTLIKEGSCSYQIQLERFTVKAGDLVFIPPALLHAISVPEGEMVSDTYVFHMHFLGSDSRDICATRYLLPLTSQELVPPYIISPAHPAYEEAMTLYLGISLAWRTRTPGFELSIRAKLLELIVTLLPHCRESTQLSRLNTEHSRKIKTALEYIAAHYTEDIAIADVAAACYFSEYHFMRFFKRCTGVSCGEHIKSLRLEKAAERFSEGETDILEVALSVGFHNLSYFYRACRGKYGITPKEFIGQKTGPLV